MTATTVGYGDVNVVTQNGRLVSAVHSIFSVLWLAALIGQLQLLSERRFRQLRHIQMLRRRLDADIGRIRQGRTGSLDLVEHGLQAGTYG